MYSEHRYIALFRPSRAKLIARSVGANTIAGNRQIYMAAKKKKASKKKTTKKAAKKRR